MTKLILQGSDSVLEEVIAMLDTRENSDTVRLPALRTLALKALDPAIITTEHGHYVSFSNQDFSDMVTQMLRSRAKKGVTFETLDLPSCLQPVWPAFSDGDFGTHITWHECSCEQDLSDSSKTTSTSEDSLGAGIM